MVNDHKVCYNYSVKEKSTFDSNKLFKLQKPRPSWHITNNRWVSPVPDIRPGAQNVLDRRNVFCRSFVPNRI